MKLNKVYLLGIVTAAVLSGCGRNDYNGTYTGTATSGQGATMSNSYYNTGYNTGYNNGYNPYAQQDTVTLSLNQNGQQVQGTYSSASGETGNFYANATSSNRLDSVQLNIQAYNGTMNGQTGYNQMPTGYAAYCAGSYFTGSLNAPDDARQIEGTLNAGGGLNAANPQCTSKTFRLFKNGNNK